MRTGPVALSHLEAEELVVIFLGDVDRLFVGGAFKQSIEKALSALCWRKLELCLLLVFEGREAASAVAGRHVEVLEEGHFEVVLENSYMLVKGF